MKLSLMFKSPETVDYAVSQNTTNKYEAEELREKLSKFVKYGEYVTIEVDTEEGTAKVVPAHV